MEGREWPELLGAELGLRPQETRETGNKEAGDEAAKQGARSLRRSGERRADGGMGRQKGE